MKYKYNNEKQRDVIRLYAKNEIFNYLDEAFVSAIEKGDRASLQQLLCVKHYDLRKKYANSLYEPMCPLMLAIKHGKVNVVNLFTEATEHHVGWVPWHYNRSKDTNLANEKMSCLEFPIIYAAKNSIFHVVYALYKGGALCNVRDEQNNASVLYYLAMNGGTKAIAYLLSFSEADVNLQSRDGQTALYKACEYGQTGAVKKLLKHKKINPNLACKKGYLAIDRAKQGLDFYKKALFEATLLTDKKEVEAKIARYTKVICHFTTYENRWKNCLEVPRRKNVWY